MEDEYEYEDDECADDDGYEDEEETVPAEWSPPQNASLRRRRGAGDGGGRRPPSIPSASMGPTPPRPQFVRRRRPGPGEVGGAGGAGRPPPPPPRLVNLSSGSGSGDSREEARAAGGDDPYCVGVAAANGGPSGRDRRPGGRIQVVGGGSTDMSPWGGIVSRSRSAESGGGGAAGMGAGSSVGGSNEWEPPRPTRQPMVPPPGPPVQGVGGGHGTTGHPHQYSNPHYVTWDYYGGQRPPHHPPPYSPEGQPSPSLAYPGPPPQSSYPPDAGGYAPYPSSYPPQYQQFRPSQYPPHHPAYSQYPHPHPHPHHYRHSHHPGVPPPGSGGVVLEDRDDKRVPEESRPLLKNYDPEVDGVGKVRPQFQNVKRGKSSVAAKVKIDRGIARLGTSDAVAVPPDSSGGRAAHLSSEDAPTANTGEFAPHTPRRRRRRNPSEKAAAAAAMAAAAAVSMRERKRKDAVAAEAKAVKREVEEARDDGTDDEDDIPNHVTTGTDAASTSMTGVIAMGGMAIVTNPGIRRTTRTSLRAKRAMASAVALRAVAGGSPVKPPKSASEVDFDIADPPTLPITEPSDVPTLESTTLMTEERRPVRTGGGTNSQMGNRRFRALVRDFQPTYLMAKRREKPKMARSVVLIIRHRGGRFLRRDDMDGRLYEVGDEKAEAKTSQALREGLDVRATKTAANTLMGTTAESTSKKRKHIPPSPSLSENEKSSKRSIVKLEGGTGVKDEKAPVRPQPVHAPSYVQASQTSRLPPVATSGGYYPPYPQRYDDPYYGAHYRPNAAATAAYEYRTPTIHLPPGSFDPPSTTHHHHIHQYARGGGYHYPPSYPGYADPREGAYPSPPPSREPGGGSKEVASSPSDAAAFSPPRSHLVKKPKMMPQHLTPIISQSKGHRLE
ncbi:hypothetical protein ACHAW5_001708 [Stephanodiscus triporus]|uniref:DUF6824 domain-containing protein n=1 Tax=Stephanodiscus triporus TaxID=2934178 RepID=A0ABD3MWI0_9STRA